MSTESIHLKGITWNHTRGYLPMVATAQRYAETHPGVEITWEKRSLQAFADHDIRELALKYDLLVIDHPWAGAAASSGILLPLQDHLPADFLADQAANSVGASHHSYAFEQPDSQPYQTALAIDAATPVAAYRPDLLPQPPQTWQDLLALARQGLVAFAGIPIDSLMSFYMLCSTLGQDPFVQDEWRVSTALGSQVLEMLRELASLVTPEIFAWNPIKVYEALTSRQDLAYCPFAYGYSNYARPGYAAHQLEFGDLVELTPGARLRTTLGGTGLAISSACTQLSTALDYARFTASQACQRGLFAESGGQPGHRQAWLDPEVNRRSSNYFINTLPALDRSYLRPRYPGYLHFQDHAGDHVRAYMLNGGSPTETLNAMQKLVNESRKAQ